MESGFSCWKLTIPLGGGSVLMEPATAEVGSLNVIDAVPALVTGFIFFVNAMLLIWVCPEAVKSKRLKRL